MTLVHATVDQERLKIQILADSRLSKSDRGLLMDGGPKIFPVSVVTANATRGAKFSRAEYGFAFAGSFLASTATHAFASNIAANLLGSRLPEIEDIADLYARSATLYLTDLAHKDFLSEFWLAGYCATTQKMRIFHIGPELHAGRWKVVVHELANDHGRVHVMGSGKAAFESYRALFVTRPQLQLVQGFIDSGRDPTVGGAIQVAVVERGRVSIPMYAHIRTPGDLSVETYFNGRKVSDIGSVGRCGIGREAFGRDMRLG